MGALLNSLAQADDTTNSFDDMARPCCEAFSAECNACAEGMTVEEYCEINKDTFVCGPCCDEDTATCNACKEMMSVEEYCRSTEGKDDVKGCYATSLFVTLNMIATVAMVTLY